ncbi:4Fe-4S dicluster domain-containing protein [Calderihabitans maritimus]|uniref:Fe-S-cluster-containing hydrogenase subunit n=1 Tax=Calderihabitans maritimus TaxID=1246530 RepID=A0A1Z5HNQ9_9FIRM|nr:4Fe-4S dicluster domain-containing protein [Calderihabitans maritimus]GAW91088.1 Fe-S-cluster-containing hydrogenase subunit [Calderihabitans maritimus]
MPKGMLIDISKCIGCRACQVACKQWNNLPAEKTTFNADWSNPPKRSATTWTKVDYHLLEEEDDIKWKFVKTQCMHCLEPACVSACFVEAFKKTEEGAVVYQENKCVGCRYCMLACPFGVPKYEWEKRFPAVRKCRLCIDRLAQGLEPACATACPTGAIKFGERDKLVKEAWERIRSGRGKYVEHVFGEKEVGGTSVLYISDVPFEKLGFPANLPHEPLPDYTWKVLTKIPGVLVGWSALLTAMYFYTKRRNELDKPEKDSHRG